MFLGPAYLSSQTYYSPPCGGGARGWGFLIYIIMNHLDYTTCGTCNRLISIDVDADGIIRNLAFEGGCNGNLKGICALCIGKKATDVKQTLKGITCGGKMTSCPDQLATALGEMGY